jgi:hypothetical protein
VFPLRAGAAALLPGSPFSQPTKKSLATNCCFATESTIISGKPMQTQRPAALWILSLQIGLEVLCDGGRGFVNCTRDFLLKDYMTLLPSTPAVVEVLESVPADDLVRAALPRLKQAGYTIALDDFTTGDPRASLTDFAD